MDKLGLDTPSYIALVVCAGCWWYLCGLAIGLVWGVFYW